MDPSDIRKYVSLPVVSPAVHHSHMATLARCPRAYLFGIRLGLKRKMQRAKALLVGSFFHLAMDKLFTGDSIQQAAAAIADAQHEEGEAIKTMYRQMKREEWIEDSLARMNQYAKLAMAMARIFVEHVPPAKFGKKYQIVPLGVERQMSVRIPELKGYGGGRFDVLLYSPHLKGLYLLDHKTISDGQDLNEYRQALSYDFQTMWYRTLLGKWLRQHGDAEIPSLGKRVRDIPIKGAVVSAILKPTIHIKEFQGFDEDDDSPSGEPELCYLNEVRDWYTGGVGPVKSLYQRKSGNNKPGDPKDYWWDHRSRKVEWDSQGVKPIDQFVIHFKGPVLPDELKTIAQYTARASRAAPTLENFPRMGELTGACTNTFGRKCEFRTLCYKDPLLWQDDIDRYYIQQTYSNNEQTSIDGHPVR